MTSLLLTPEVVVSAFKLSENFINKYKTTPPPFDALGALVYARTYSRVKEDGSNEQWWETVQRVVEGTYTVQKRWIESRSLGWNAWRAQKSAQEMYDRIFNLKFVPPGRGLWVMGTPIVEEKGLAAALNNCGFVSTEDMKDDPSKPFIFLMDMSMLGVGVGFNTNGAGTVIIREPKKSAEFTYVIPDTREGWVESVRLLLDSYFHGSASVTFDYSLIRPKGSPIKTFGGTASGPGPLKDLHKNLGRLLSDNVDNPISVTMIVDIMNYIGVAVVAGNVRRTAEISFGNYDDPEYLSLKDYRWDAKSKKFVGSAAHRADRGWASNNSIYADLGMDYSKVAEQISINGEPGLIWMHNIKNFSRMCDAPDGKDHRAAGTNPCSEQSLESQELCCVSYDTRILTKNGNPKIGDVVGEHVEVWNGEEWSSVVPFLAAKNKNLHRVTLSDGSYLDVTDDHNWSVRSQTARKYRQKNTIELNIGDYVQSFDISNDIPYGNEEEHAYKYGFFAGDGFINKSKNYKYSLCVVQSPEYEAILPELMGVEYNEQHPTGYTNPFKRVNISEHLEISICEQLRDSSTGLPDEFFSWDSKSISDFFGGWIDSDGSLREQLNTDNYILFGSELKLRDAQLLLRRIGINHATLSKWASKGDETNKGIRNKDLWALYIPTYESMHINTKLKNATRFGSRYKINNAHPNGKLIDTSRKQKIVSIEKLEGKHDTFCFNEPVNHMGVFGNVLTYQCLVETFPTKHDSMEDYLRTLKFAYLYAKTVTLLSTHWPETNRVLLRNARIGCSMSGIVQFLDKHGLNTLKLWCDNGYRTVKEWDEVYSDWLCVPKSIKVTSVKPSGTVSLLAGVTPGVHFPEHTHYIRRVNLAKDSPLVNAVTSAGYKVEDSAYDKASCVVEIPVHMDHARPSSKVSIWEKAGLAVFMQTYWADNQVSCTVTFDPERESGEIEKVLDLFQYQLKGISFLPSIKGGAYAQMPYEAITEEKYNELVKSIKPIDFSLLKHNKAVVDKFCDSDTCELPFKKGDE